MNRIVTGYHMDAPAMKKQNSITRFDFLKTKLVMRLLMMVAMIVALSLFYIWSRVQIVQIGYELNEYTMEQEMLVNENKRLRMELSLMKAPDRIKTYAVEKLHMKFPDQRSMIEVK